MDEWKPYWGLGIWPGMNFVFRADPDQPGLRELLEAMRKAGFVAEPEKRKKKKKDEDARPGSVNEFE